MRSGDLIALARVGRILFPAPHHGIAPQVVALGELVVGLRVEGRISDRVEQQLQPNSGSPPPRSRYKSVSTVAMLPPTPSPDTARRVGSMPCSAPFWATHRATI